MSLSIPTSTSSALSPWTGTSSAVLAKASGQDSVEAQFLKEAHKTPAQHIRDAILKSMGLTEQDLAKMDPAKRAAIEKEIATQIEQQLKANTDSKPGSFADLRA